MSVNFAIESVLPKAGPAKEPKAQAPKCPAPGSMAHDTFESSGTDIGARIEAALDKRAKAQRIITMKLTQLYVGWNPKSDAAYQQAVKDRNAAECELDRLRPQAPDLVKAAEQRRSWGGWFGQLWEGVKSFWQAIPWNPMWGPFVPRKKDADPPKVILA